MPELPEVEVTRRSIADRIQGAHIHAVRLGKPLRWPLGCEPDALVGRRVLDVGRRGKYLLMHLDHGVLLLHLGMSGSLSLTSSPPAPGPHDHCDIETSHGTLRLHDPRRFGAVVHADALQDAVVNRLLGHLGVEPFGESFTPELLLAGLKRRRAPIKQVLLAGDVVVGVGNIYACEVLFLSRIRPTTRADRLSATRAARLHAAIVTVLQRAVVRGGSTLRDFSDASGVNGHYQHEAMVYGRTGEPCRVCASPIQGLRQGQRSTFFCPHCQRA